MTDKKFSEMSANEFSSAKRLALKELTTPPDKSFTDKPFTDYSLDKTYFLDLMTQKRKQADGIAWLRDRHLSNDELKEKISTQLKWEKEKKEQSVNVISWEKLLETKLFQNPKI